MIKDIVSRLNWLDVVIIVLSLRIIYSGLLKGLPIEIFKTIGILAGAIFSLNYYPALSAFINSKINFSPELVDFNSYLVILFSAVVSLALIRDIVLKLVKIEAVSALNKWGGICLGFARSLIITSAILFSFLIINNDYLKTSMQKSYFSKNIVKINAKIYEFTWQNLVIRFFPGNTFNNKALELTNQI
jgi:uncharacterized membrane protein required for colicin V production